MSQFIFTWLKIQKKWIMFLLLGSFFLSLGAVFIQKKEAQVWEAQQIECIDTWYKNTKMELMRGEVNAWNDYIGSMLSDLGILKTLWKRPDLYSEQIVECENAYYSKAIQDPGYCQRILNQDVSIINQKLELAATYQEKGWIQPLNPEEPRADYMVYSADHYFSGIVLIILGICCGIGVWIWAWMYESREYLLLFSLPYSKLNIFLSLILITLGISLIFLLFQYGSLWFIGLIVQGNEPLLIVENNQIVSCSLSFFQNLKYSVLLSFLFLSLSSLISVLVRTVSDALMILMIILMAFYFAFSSVAWFNQIPLWGWLFSVFVSGIGLIVTWEKFKFEEG